MSKRVKKLEEEIEIFEACTILVKAMKKRYKGWSGLSQFDGTENRLYRLYEEFCWTPKKIEEHLSKTFKVFDHTFDEMVVVGPFNVNSLCPHHLLPCKLEVTIGYIPNKNGKVLGLSKFIRISEIVGKRPILQEQYSQELADVFVTNLEPRGIAIHVVGDHGCMGSRGVKQHTPVVTSVIKGAFETQPETRAEFYAITRSGRFISK